MIRLVEKMMSEMIYDASFFCYSMFLILIKAFTCASIYNLESLLNNDFLVIGLKAILYYG